MTKPWIKLRDIVLRKLIVTSEINLEHVNHVTRKNYKKK